MSPPKKPPNDSRLARLVRLGMGAFWMTEKVVRSAMRDLPLTKEASQFVLEQLDRRKADVLDVVRNEIQRAVEKLDIPSLAKDLLNEHDIEVTAQIRFRRRK